MDISELGLPEQPLIDDPPYNTNRRLRIKRTFIIIIVGGISLAILLIVLAVSMLLIYARRQPPKQLPIHQFVTPTRSITRNKFTTAATTVLSTTTSGELKMTGKQRSAALCLQNTKTILVEILPL
jgi:hypothetical protein